jgi:hypothetical protein
VRVAYCILDYGKNQQLNQSDLTNITPLLMRILLQFDSVPCATIVRCLETEPNGVIIGV